MTPTSSRNERQKRLEKHFNNRTRYYKKVKRVSVSLGVDHIVFQPSEELYNHHISEV